LAEILVANFRKRNQRAAYPSIMEKSVNCPRISTTCQRGPWSSQAAERDCEEKERRKTED